jgi:hypothetical protein
MAGQVPTSTTSAPSNVLFALREEREALAENNRTMMQLINQLQVRVTQIETQSAHKITALEATVASQAECIDRLAQNCLALESKFQTLSYEFKGHHHEFATKGGFSIDGNTPQPHMKTTQYNVTITSGPNPAPTNDLPPLTKGRSIQVRSRSVLNYTTGQWE